VQPLVFNQLVLGGEGKTPAKIIQSGDVKGDPCFIEFA